MNSQEIFKREVTDAGFEIEIYQGGPAIRVSKEELDDILKIVTVKCVTKDCRQFLMVWPEN